MNAIDIALRQRGSGCIALAVFLVNLINGHDVRLRITISDKQQQNQKERVYSSAFECQRAFGSDMVWAKLLKITPK